MKKQMTYVMVAALMVLAAGVRADEPSNSTAKDTVAHPVEAYHRHEVKEDAADAQMYAQQKAEAKARLDQAKADYEKSLQTNGASNEVTKEAKKRFADARKEYRKFAKKTSKAEGELQENQQKLNQDNAAK